MKIYFDKIELKKQKVYLSKISIQNVYVLVCGLVYVRKFLKFDIDRAASGLMRNYHHSFAYTKFIFESVWMHNKFVNLTRSLIHSDFGCGELIAEAEEYIKFGF